MSAYEHHTVQIEDATLRTNDDGLLEAVLDDAVTITKVDAEQDADADTDSDNHTDGDGDETGTETPETTASADSPDAPQSSSDTTETAADGGSTEHADIRERVAAAFDVAVNDDTELADKMPLQRELLNYCEDMTAAKELIDQAKKQGWISEPASHRYRRESLPDTN